MLTSSTMVLGLALLSMQPAPAANPPVNSPPIVASAIKDANTAAESKMAKAVEAEAQERWEEAVGLLSELWESYPMHLRIAIRWTEAVEKTGDARATCEAMERVARADLCRLDETVAAHFLFEAAKLRARVGDLELAMDNLEGATAAGWLKSDLVLSDLDLSKLRKSPRLAPLVKKMDENAPAGVPAANVYAKRCLAWAAAGKSMLNQSRYIEAEALLADAHKLALRRLMGPKSIKPLDADLERLYREWDKPQKASTWTGRPLRLDNAIIRLVHPSGVHVKAKTLFTIDAADGTKAIVVEVQTGVRNGKTLAEALGSEFGAAYMDNRGKGFEKRSMGAFEVGPKIVYGKLDYSLNDGTYRTIVLLPGPKDLALRMEVITRLPFAKWDDIEQMIIQCVSSVEWLGS